MPNYQGQNYKVNRKVKEAVDRNQINYRESPDTPLSIIKRVYVYITDKKGHVLPEVTVVIDGETIKTGYSGLLISNFPNQEKTITVSKEGYKSATATIILDAEIQTHKFFLALETDDDESEVISTDDTQENNEFNLCGTLLELSDNNTLQIWNTFKTNEISEGVYTGGGSYIQEGWSNEGLWQMDFDYKYSTSSSVLSYVGLMPLCPGEIIIDETDSFIEQNAMITWEMGASLWGMDSICTKGPAYYKYKNVTEYQHVTIKKIDSTTIEYYFDNNKWVYSVPKLTQLDTLYFGLRDNVASRGPSTKGATISVKNLKIVGLCSKAKVYDLNETVELDQIYSFTSYADENGETEWGTGTVQIIEIPDDDEAFIKVKVLTNEPDDSFVNQVFYIQKNAEVGNNIYPLYSDNNETEAGIYVSIDNQVEQTEEDDSTDYDIILSTDKETLSLSNNESAQISVTASSPSIISNFEEIFVYDSSRIEYENGSFYFPIDCLDTAWNVNCTFHPTPSIVDANKEIVIPRSSLSNYTFGWENDSFTKTTSGGTTSTISEISRGFTGFLKYDNTGVPDNDKYQQLLIPESYFGLFYKLENIEEKITFSVDMIKEDAQLKGFIIQSNSILPYTSNTCTITKTE